MVSARRSSLQRPVWISSSARPSRSRIRSTVSSITSWPSRWRSIRATARLPLEPSGCSARTSANSSRRSGSSTKRRDGNDTDPLAPRLPDDVRRLPPTARLPRDQLVRERDVARAGGVSGVRGFFGCHRALIILRANSTRSLLLLLAHRALPPRRPRATAAGFFFAIAPEHSIRGATNGECH